MIGGYFAFFFVCSPIFIGSVVGLLAGNIIEGLRIGGGIAAVFAGIIAPGGNLPTDSALAACVVIPMALYGGLSTEQAIALALPMGIVGAKLAQYRKTLILPIVKQADECINNGDLKGLRRCALFTPALMEIPLLFLSVTSVCFVGLVLTVLVKDIMPQFILTGLQYAGSILPAIALALIVNLIGKLNFVIYALISFILMRFLDIDIVAVSILALLISITIVVLQNKVPKQETKEIPDRSKTSLGKRDLYATIARWYVSCEISLNPERMQAIAYCYALAPVLRKLYPEDDKFIEALKRHSELFNTNATAGGMILGTTLALEEDKANNYDAIPANTINMVKTNLMGPVAAFGDSFTSGKLTILGILVASGFAKYGTLLGLLLLLLSTMITLIELIYFTNLTYKKGKNIIREILSHQIVKKIGAVADIFGMFTVGILASTLVANNISTISLVNNVAPIILICLAYFIIIKKNQSTTKVIYITILLSICAGLIRSLI